ncbi:MULTISPECIES: hydrogenase maturation protease [Dethiosulfovibrio]|uniref:Hydrogenase maturation protease n=2 Tax=Dethiosulfovibrio TaxID=47054 RepID=A0ABS9ENM8_9BACT|nr:MULTISPECIES: hydrogenase maturation protease [Dethiosulfovibrio]MCF4112959.1 hydrogenase maturation protease [Dethiosulfovibrio russensis]MCF4141423.1 hydrogenase maturation protease [Dethiosulfovibrio marinus]MCF4144379.1 hydrogenase maturation protease [Dethiosulfovibrio acidaminovorans]
MNKTMIWGLGNELYGDDAVGVIISDRLKVTPPADTVVYTCYTVPGNYVYAIKKESPERLILVDASDMGLMPGDFRRFSIERISDVSFTNHDMPLNLMLNQFDLETFVIGIQPDRVVLGAPLSVKVASAAEKVERILRRGRAYEIAPL